MRLLVIEDDPTIAGFVCQGLEELGYAVDVVGDGKAGEAHAASGEYDVLIGHGFSHVNKDRFPLLQPLGE